MKSISVVIPCFNAGSFLMNCISSVKRQQGQRERFFIKEIIVIDDASTDEVTIDILENFRKSGDIVVLRNAGQKGSAGARNTGIKYAKGEWVAFLDADDWWSDCSLEVRFAALDQFKGSEWVGGDFLDYSNTKESSFRGRFSMNLDRYEFLKIAYEPINRPILIKNPLQIFLNASPTNTIVTMIRKEVLDYHGGFNEYLLRAQDYHLWIRLASKHSFVFVPEILAYYRHHENNSTKSTSETLLWRIAALTDLFDQDKFYSVREIIGNKLYSAYMDLSFESRKELNFKEAVKAARGAIQLRPYSRDAWKNFLAGILGY